LGPLEILPHAIASRSWHRITFLYTSGDKLLNAREIHDLVVPTADRETLWNALRDRSDSFAVGNGDAGNIPWADAWKTIADWFEAGPENS